MMTSDQEFERLRLDRKNFSSGYDYRSGCEQVFSCLLFSTMLHISLNPEFDYAGRLSETS